MGTRRRTERRKARHEVERLEHDVRRSNPDTGSSAGSGRTVSVGVALARPGSKRSLAGAIQIADEALYQAKSEGRNRVVLVGSHESAVETGNFRVVFRETG